MVHHTDKMRAVEFIGKPNDMVVESVHIPKIQDPLDAIIRVTSAGICGTDLHILHGRFGAQPPLTMGHETVGIVEAVGAGVTTIKVGDRVGVYDGVCCGFCANCVKGLTAYCLTLGQDFIGLGEPVGSKTPQNNGGQAQHIRMPHAEQSVIVLPPGKQHELDYLLLTDIWPTAWTGLDFSGFQPGDTVAVFGAGPVGLLVAYSALLRGASKVYNIDHVAARLAKAHSIGSIPIDFSKGDPVAQILKREPSGVDRCVDACGYECVDANGANDVSLIINQAINLAKSGGGIGVIGVYLNDDPLAPTPKFQKGIIDFPFGTLWLKQLSLKSGPVSIRDLVPTLKALIESGRAQPSFVFEREISIEQAHDAYEEFSNHEFVKAHIAFPEHC